MWEARLTRTIIHIDETEIESLFILVTNMKEGDEISAFLGDGVRIEVHRLNHDVIVVGRRYFTCPDVGRWEVTEFEGCDRVIEEMLKG